MPEWEERETLRARSQAAPQIRHRGSESKIYYRRKEKLGRAFIINLRAG